MLASKGGQKDSTPDIETPGGPKKESESSDCITIFQLKSKIFEFNKSIEPGAYEIPFTFKLPNNIPSSF